MSFVIAVDRFLSVAFSDDGGSDVTAFVATPTARTQQMMQDFGIVFRAREDGLSLYYKSNPVVSPALVSPITDRVRFSFSLVARGPDPSLLFADLSGPDGSHFLLDNLDGAGAIQQGGQMTSAATVGPAEHISALPNRAPIRVELSGGVPAELRAEERFGAALVASTPIQDLAAQPPVAPPPGASEVTAILDIPTRAEAALRALTPAPGSVDRLIYADDEVASRPAVGIVDLYWQGPQDAVPTDVGLNYTAVFARN